jgi:N-glycosylase/DNA lyase
MTISINDDFDLDKIIGSGQCFRPCKICDFPKTYRFVYGTHILYIIQTDKNTYDISCTEDEWNNIWNTYFDLSRNYGDIRKSIPTNDTYMFESAVDGKGIRILRQDKWEMLISFIISQRKSIPAIRSCIEKLCSKYGTKLSTDKEDIFLFPTAQQLMNASENDLAACGLGYRVGYILDAVRKVYFKEIDLEEIDNLSDEDLFNELTCVRGVGKKVANCIMLFAYNRIGRAPVDVWIARVIDEFYDGKDPFDMYGENAGIMQQYVFYHIQNRHR